MRHSDSGHVLKRLDGSEYGDPLARADVEDLVKRTGGLAPDPIEGGDVSPRQRGWDGVAATGKLLAAAVLALWPRIPPDGDQRLTAGGETAALPAPALELHNCLGRWIPRGTRVA